MLFENDKITENFLTIDLLLKIHNGYCISHQVPISFERGFVLAYNTFKKEFVTWEYGIELEENYSHVVFNHGHYISNETSANIDFWKRIEREIEYRLNWLTQKREYEIKNGI